MIKVDLHTHSIASHDGGITAEQYKHVLESGILDCIAITDHNRIDFAQKLQKDLGPQKIIIGEEISTNQGDIIGLFLNDPIPADLDLKAAIEMIKSQNGIVYVPHPFETVRKGISEDALKSVNHLVDIVESANGRAYFQNLGPKAHTWAHINRKATFSSSDAHRSGGLGRTYTILKETPSRENILKLCNTGRKIYQRPGVADILAPKMNRLRKKNGAK
jgi:predicted metal-dependent phosphoesterase TrpH